MSTYTYPQLAYALIARQSPSAAPFPKLQNQLGIAIWGAYLQLAIASQSWEIWAPNAKYGLW
jgi:hypothetical protein